MRPDAFDCGKEVVFHDDFGAYGRVIEKAVSAFCSGPVSRGLGNGGRGHAREGCGDLLEALF